MAKVKVTAGDPVIELSLDDLLYRVAQLCKNRGLADDVAWSAEVATRFSVANVNGAATLADLRAQVALQTAFLKEFFDKLVKVG